MCKRAYHGLIIQYVVSLLALPTCLLLPMQERWIDLQALLYTLREVND